MFDGILCNYTGSEYKIEFLEGVKPIHYRLFPLPKINVEILKTKLH